MSGTAIHAGTVLVGDGDVIEGGSIGIRDGAIREVEAGSLSLEYDDEVYATDRVVMPGLIDAHVHLVYTGRPDEVGNRDVSDEYLTLRAAELARDSLRAGVTTLGDMAARNNTIVGLRDAIDDEVTLGPRIKACGNMVAISGGRATGGEPGGNIREADGPDEVRKVVRRLLMYRGVDVIKLAATGALSSPHTGARDPQLTVAEMRAAVEEAHAVGRPVHAHCYGEEGIGNAIEAGVDAVVHGQSLTDDHIEEMKDRGTMLVPTLSTFRGERHAGTADDPFVEAAGVERPDSSAGVVEETESNFKNALESGITIAMGSDTGMPYVYHGDNATELEYMADWGMDEMDAIVASTRTAARSLGVGDVLGTVEPGKHADLLVVDGDPVADVGVLRDPEAIDRVMLDGEFVDA